MATVEQLLLKVQIKDLRTLAKEYNLPTQGTRAQLVQRLLEHRPRVVQRAGAEDDPPRIFSNLPDDAIVDTLVQMDQFDLLKMCQTDRKIAKLCTDQVWKQKTLRDLPIYKRMSEAKLTTISNWRDEYWNHSLLGESSNDTGNFSGYIRWIVLRDEDRDQIQANFGRLNDNEELLTTDPIYNKLVNLIRTFIAEWNRNHPELVFGQVPDRESLAFCRFSPDGHRALLGVLKIDDVPDFESIHDTIKIMGIIDVKDNKILCHIETLEDAVTTNPTHRALSHSLYKSRFPPTTIWSMNANTIAVNYSESYSGEYYTLAAKFDNPCIVRRFENTDDLTEIEQSHFDETLQVAMCLSDDGTKLAKLYYISSYYNILEEKLYDEYYNKRWINPEKEEYKFDIIKSDTSLKILRKSDTLYTIVTEKRVARLFICNIDDQSKTEITYNGIYDISLKNNQIKPNTNWFMYIDWNATPITDPVHLGNDLEIENDDLEIYPEALAFYNNLLKMPLKVRLQIIEKLSDEKLQDLCKVDRQWHNFCQSSDMDPIWRNKINKNVLSSDSPIRNMLNESIQTVNAQLGTDYRNWFQIFHEQNKIPQAQNNISGFLRSDDPKSIFDYMTAHSNFFKAIYSRKFLDIVEEKIRRAYRYGISRNDLTKPYLKNVYRKLFSTNLDQVIANSESKDETESDENEEETNN